MKGLVKIETEIEDRIFCYEYKCCICGTDIGNSDGIFYESSIYQNAQ